MPRAQRVPADGDGIDADGPAAALEHGAVGVIGHRLLPDRGIPKTDAATAADDPEDGTFQAVVPVLEQLDPLFQGDDRAGGHVAGPDHGDLLALAFLVSFGARDEESQAFVVDLDV